jgi:uncharacterized protein (DUF433 family)
MKLPPFLTEWPGNEIMLNGHRISLYHVISSYNDGMSVKQLQEEYPTLAPALIQQVLAFYYKNQAEVDDYVADYRAELDRQAAAAPRANLEELRQRYEAKKREEAKKRAEAK